MSRPNGEIDIDETIIDNNIDIDEEIEIETEEDDNYDNIGLEDYKALLERNRKAEKALYELKKEKKKETKETKEVSKEKVDNPKEVFKQLLAEERFYNKNPEADLYREKIEYYQNKGLELDEAYELAKLKDKKVEENREIYGKSFVKGNQQSTEGVNLVSIEEYDKMTAEQVNQYNQKMTAKYGGVRFK